MPRPASPNISRFAQNGRFEMTSYEPLRRVWSAAELLDGVRPEDVRVSVEEGRAHEARLWTDLAAEHDGRLLQAEVLGRGTEYSPAFHAFLQAWADDAAHHAAGLLRLCSLVLREPEEALLAHCRERIAGYKVPRSVSFRQDPLPVSGPGKVLKRELRAPYWEGRDRGIS